MSALGSLPSGLEAGDPTESLEPAAIPLPARGAKRRDSLGRRASLTAVASLLDYASKVGVGLLVTPILLSGLGEAVFGVWASLSRLINYMSATDGRPSEALRLIVANQQATADGERQRRYVGSALAVWIICLPLGVAVGAIMMWIAPAMTNAPDGMARAVRMTSVLLVAAFLAASLGSIPESALRGMNLGYRRMGLQTGMNLLGGLLLAGAVMGGFGLVGLGIAQIVVAVITGLVFWVLAARYVEWFGAVRPASHDVRGMLGMSAWLGVGDLVSKLLLGSDVLILGIVLSPVAVTTYLMTATAATTAVGILSFVVAAAMPGLGGLIGHGEMARASRLRREIFDGTWVFIVAAGATILLWNRAFVALWVGPTHYAGAWVNALVVIMAAQTAFIRTDAYILDAALKPRARVVASAAAAAASISLSFIGAKWWGIPGLCVGLVLGRAVQSVAYPVLARRYLAAGLSQPGPTNRSGVVSLSARPFLFTALALAAAAALGERVTVPQWALWGAGAAITFGAFLIAAFFLGLAPDRRRALLGRVISLRAGALPPQ